MINRAHNCFAFYLQPILRGCVKKSLKWDFFINASALILFSIILPFSTILNNDKAKKESQNQE
jgi:hypothetical protein